MKNQKIAIVGMSGRFPEANSIRDFYLNLKNGKDSVRSISKERISSTAIDPNKDYQLMAYLEDIVSFDYKFFGLSFKEAKSMDPRQRLLLEVAFEAFENAGLSLEKIKKSETAVFIADTILDYFKLTEEYDITLDMGVTSSMMAGRLSRFFQLKGKSIMIDSACSSSLIAIESGFYELASGRADYVLVGAADLSIFPLEKYLSEEVDILSPSGKCKPFSDKADGIGTGEAVACLVLRRLEDAVADNDIIHGVIRSVAVNQDADMIDGLTAPNPTAQMELLLKAWSNAEIQPNEIGFIEAHGTGTKLGDPIEIAAIIRAIEKSSTAIEGLPIASVKSNLGHTDSAAGITSVIKTVLQLKNKEIFPSLHFDRPNAFIDFENSPLTVNTKLKKWDLASGQKIRLAGVSGFGLMGTNCHLVLEEAPERKTNKDNLPQYLFTCSAKTKESLEKNIDQLIGFVKSNGNTNASDLSYTLCVSRSSHQEKFSTVFSDYSELLEKLSLRKGVYTIGRKNLKTFFVFSSSYEGDLEITLKQFKEWAVFRTIFKKVEHLWEENAIKPSYVNIFLFQYTVYKVLETFGVNTPFLLGDGVGKVLISLLLGKVDFAGAIDTAKNYQPLDENNRIGERMHQLVEAELKNGELCFVEMGGKGNLSSSLCKICNDSHIGVIHLNRSTTFTSLDLLQQLYESGIPIEWKLWSDCVKGKLIELPEYQFEKKRCWIREPLQKTTPLLTADKYGDYLFKTNWQEIEEADQQEKNTPQGNFLLLPDQLGLVNDDFFTYLNNSWGLIRIDHGDSFKKISQTHYQIDPDSEKDHIDVVDAIRKDGMIISGIIDLSLITSSKGSYQKDPTLFVTRQFLFAKALKDRLNNQGFIWFAMGNNVFKVFDTDVVTPEKYMYDSFQRALVSDFNNLTISFVDIDIEDSINGRQLADILVRELTEDKMIRRVSHRSKKRYIPKISSVGLDSVAFQPYHYENGIYVITGGATGIGLEMAKHVIRNITKGHLIILGRTVLPSYQDWDSILSNGDAKKEIHKRIKSLTELRSDAVKITYLSTDLTNPNELNAYFKKVFSESQNERFCGIIHSAGIDSDNVALGIKTMDSFKQPFKTKVHGTINLYEAVKQYHPDFFVCMSSLNALLPQKNSFDYAAANAYEDSFCISNGDNRTKLFSINWPGWNRVGMSFGTLDDAENCVFPEEGIKIIDLVLSGKESNVHVIKSKNLNYLKNPYFIMEGFSTPSKIKSSVELDQKVLNQTQTEKLTTSQSKILKMFYELLEEDYIGIEHDFFDLGGHSLIGSKLVNRIFRDFGVTLEFEKVLDYSTVRSLAEYVDVLILTKNVTDVQVSELNQNHKTYEL